MLTRVVSSVLWVNTVNIFSLLNVSGNPFVTGFPERPTFGQQWNFDGTTGPAAAELWYGALTLSAGALSIDFTALVDSAIGTVDLSGKKLAGLALQAPSANSGTITIKPGASNPYSGWMGSNGFPVGKGDQHLLGPYNASIPVDGTHKTIDLAGSGTDSLNAIMLFQ